MSLENLYYASQIVASFAVIASLIYLALQTRQTARNQRTLMHESRVQMISRDFERMMDPALTRLFALFEGRHAAPEKGGRHGHLGRTC